MIVLNSHMVWLLGCKFFYSNNQVKLKWNKNFKEVTCNAGHFFAYFCKIRPISAIGIDIILKDAILQLEAHQPKRTVSQKKR